MNSKNIACPIESIAAKRTLNALDVGRVLLQNTVDCTLNPNDAKPVPPNVQHFLSAAELSVEDAIFLKRVNATLVFIAQYRGTAEAHRMRLSSHLSNCTSVLSTSMAIESMLAYSPSAAMAYAEPKAPRFVGMGIECFIAELNPDYVIFRDGLTSDFMRARESVRFIKTYNAVLQMTAQALNVPDLSMLEINDRSILSSIDSYRKTAADLRQMLQKNRGFPHGDEKLEALSLFDSFSMDEILLNADRLAAIEKGIQTNLSFFENPSSPFDALCKEGGA